MTDNLFHHGVVDFAEGCLKLSQSCPLILEVLCAKPEVVSRVGAKIQNLRVGGCDDPFLPTPTPI